MEAGYEQAKLSVSFQNGTVEAFMYCVDEGEGIDDSLQPYTWYKALVVAGAREHRLSEDYVSDLERVDAFVDPDRERERRERALL